MPPVRWYFYGGVKGKRRKTEKKAGMELLYRALGYCETAGHDKYLRVMYYKSDPFQLKDSVGKGKLISKI